MTTPRQGDDNSWRRHEVPTYMQAQDTWLFGMSFRQLLAVAVGCGIGYALYQLLWFLGFWFRVGSGVTVVLLSAAFVTLKPGGRSLFAVLFEVFSYQFRSKHHSDMVRHLISGNPGDQFRPQRRRKMLTIPIPMPSNTIYIKLRLPVGRRREAAAILLSLAASVLAAGSMGCGVTPAGAQTVDNYLGKRVYLQSVVVDYTSDIDEGGRAGVVRLKAAGPLRWAQPRLLESVQSVTEKKAHGTATEGAPRFGLGPYGGTVAPFSPENAIKAGDEFVFEHVLLQDRRQLRPYCDIALENGQYLDRGPALGEGHFFRQHSNDCRMIQPLNLAFLPAGAGISNEFSITKPDIGIQWEDIKRNKGALAVEGPMLPYPAPSLYKMQQELVDVGSELMNPAELCDARDIRVKSLGLQSEQPADPGAVDYFEGRGGRRISGVVEVCDMEDSDRMASIGLSEMVVFAQGNTDFEITVRPIVTTLVPENVVNRATLYVIDSESGGYFGPSSGFPIPRLGDADYDPENPNTVKFNVSVPPSSYLAKDFADELDEARFQLQLVVDHVVTVKRPVYQPIQTFNEFGQTHITSCSCSCSGGGCSNACSSRSCSKNSSQSRAYFIYWEPHFRVDDEERAYLPTDPSSDVALRYSQTLDFEPMVVAFDRPFETLIYVEPTPRAGHEQVEEYHAAGEVVGRLGGWLDGEEIVCGPGVAAVGGEATGWVWVEPGVNSLGEGYGGCRPDFTCKLAIPAREEVFGTDLPTEEDYICLEYDHDAE